MGREDAAGLRPTGLGKRGSGLAAGHCARVGCRCGVLCAAPHWEARSVGIGQRSEAAPSLVSGLDSAIGSPYLFLLCASLFESAESNTAFVAQTFKLSNSCFTIPPISS